ncbi:MAG: hypothetical protein ACJ786_22620, partial [Catenulispora sp.]
MSGHRRTAGLAAALAAAALTAGPSLATAPAFAADSPTVSFTGGSVLNVVVCKSQPSPARVTVPAESRVMFANRLGQTATLRVGGDSVATVGPNQAVPVVFHYGPVSVSMTFSCGAGVVQKFGSATVDVTRAPRAAAPNVVAKPKPAAGGAGTTRTAPTGSASRAVSNRSGLSAAHGTAAGESATTAEPSPSDAVPSTDPSADPSALALGPATGGTPTDGSGSGNAPVQIEPVVPASGTPQDSASGLLAMLAAVCAVGVTIAATRAIISKRTIHA